MNDRPRKYGLIGYPLSHTFSPTYFAKKFDELGLQDCSYEAYPLASIDLLPQLLETGLSGLNVTIPYKETVIPYIDVLSEACQRIKAVNTIKVIEDKLYGFNTDVIGFQETLVDMLDGTRPHKALVLGSGGASKAVIYVLQSLGIKYTLVSRNSPHMTYGELTDEVIEAHRLIVNTTPLGMSPQEDTYPLIPYESISSKHFLYDLIYNPEKTIFLKRGQQQGATIRNGYGMLISQAEASWNIWNT